MGATCSEAPCDRPVQARGLCWKHYQRLRRHGSPSAQHGREGSPQERFDRFVNRAAGDTGCWIWMGALTAHGYGRYVGVAGAGDLAHRAALVLAGRDLPEFDRTIPMSDRLSVDHLCGTRACVNPDHLEIVTMRENLRRRRRPAAAQ